jgi:phenylalanine-4-hydroxylase
MKVASDPNKFRQWERLFWFGVEFSLIKTNQGNQIFGAGIASSFNECSYALSENPKVLPFDIEDIRNREFSIDRMQDTIYLLESKSKLYNC